MNIFISNLSMVLSVWYQIFQLKPKFNCIAKQNRNTFLIKIKQLLLVLQCSLAQLKIGKYSKRNI